MQNPPTIKSRKPRKTRDRGCIERMARESRSDYDPHTALAREVLQSMMVCAVDKSLPARERLRELRAYIVSECAYMVELALRLPVHHQRDCLLRAIREKP